jgi:hypothetical protein
MVNLFETKLSLAEFSAGNMALTSSEFVPVAKFQIGKKVKIAPGAGVVRDGVDLRETFTLNIKDTSSVNIPGVARWVIKDANEANALFGKEFPSADLIAGVKQGIRTDRVIGEDAYLVLEYKSTASTGAAVFANCTGSFPVTKELINNLPQ